MKPLFYAAFIALVCSIAFLLLVSCFAKSNETKGDETTETLTTDSHTECAESISPCKAQEILDGMYDNVTLKDERIYLVFGSRSTLTVDNFNKLIFHEQLGFTDDRFTFIIDPDILSVLRTNDAYGGIGYGQEWIATMNVSVKDNLTGETSSPAQLVFTFLKSEEADEKLTYTAYSATESSPEIIE